MPGFLRFPLFTGPIFATLRSMKRLLPVLIALATATAAETHDLVIYGGTSAGVIAAIQAKRMGKSVVVVSPDKHLGGLTAGGLGWTDSGNKNAIGGLSREFYQRIKKHYDDPAAWRHQKSEEYKRYRPGDDAMWVFEPSVAEAVYEAWVEETGIEIHRDEWLDRGKGVVVKDGRVVSITTLGGRTWTGRMFVDATYEGDLMAAAGVTYTVGRESNATYGETLNGVQKANAVKHQFLHPISAYVVPGDPDSGLLPRVHGDDPGEDGAGDHRLQAYNYRMCLTRVAGNRVPFPKPANYDPLQYELLARELDAGWRGVWVKFDPAPNGKTDTNNHGPFSTDNIGMNYDYPEAGYERRREILREHRDYQQGWCWFLANDPRVPADVRARMSEWGLAKDEFLDNGHWPHQIYVREARRMVGDFVVTERHLKRETDSPRPIGMGSYNMDSHNTQRYVTKEGLARNEGDIQVNPGGPYPIDYGAILPPRAECANLLVPVAVSASHIAYGSIRMEPVFMILGQSAATAASLAIDEGIAVQDLSYETLRERLLAEGQVLELTSGTGGVDPKSLKGVVIDDGKAIRTGDWVRSHSRPPYVGFGYRHDGDTDKGRCEVAFKFKGLTPGVYEVRVSYSADPNRATKVPVRIQAAGAAETVFVNQRNTPAIGGLWQSLGRFEFDAAGEVVIGNADTDGYVVVDAVQLLP